MISLVLSRLKGKRTPSVFSCQIAPFNNSPIYLLWRATNCQRALSLRTRTPSPNSNSLCPKSQDPALVSSASTLKPQMSPWDLVATEAKAYLSFRLNSFWLIASRRPFTRVNGAPQMLAQGRSPLGYQPCYSGWYPSPTPTPLDLSWRAAQRSERNGLGAGSLPTPIALCPALSCVRSFTGKPLSQMGS
jgi:hypothetical protein